MRIIHWFLKVCLGDRTAHTIGWALLPAFALGVFPVASLQWILSIAAAILLRFNIATLIIFTAFFHFLTLWLDGLAHTLGKWLLVGTAVFSGVWPRLYHAPLLPYTLFNHTIVTGYFVFWVAVIPLCFFATSLIEAHGDSFVRWFHGTDLWQSMASSRFYRRLSQYIRYENN